MHTSVLSRTSSAASISSDDTARRTRKRFSSVQLMMLEQLFHQSSHPTREQREEVAQAAGMEMKSVTIWFQNKRQTERKVALHHASQSVDGHRSTPFSFPSVSSPTLSSPYASSSASGPGIASPHSIRLHTRTLSSASTTHAHTPRRKITPPRSRPSLDHVASRSESRLPPPRTPTKPHDPHASLWDNMPSSPIAPPASPPSRDLIEFMGGSRTLEWACAAARLADKEGRRRSRVGEPDLHLDSRETEQGRERGREGDETEEEDIEAVTPEGSLGSSDVASWHTAQIGVRPLPSFPRPPRISSRAPTSASLFDLVSEPAAKGKWSEDVNVIGRGVKDAPQDEDRMRAALALCGLGRRSG